MLLVEDENMVQTLISCRSDPTLRNRICVGRLWRSQYNLTSVGLEDMVETLAELRIAIMDQVAKHRVLILQIPGQVASLLGDPG